LIIAYYSRAPNISDIIRQSHLNDVSVDTTTHGIWVCSIVPADPLSGPNLAALHVFGGKMTTFEPKSTILVDSMDLIAIKNPDVLLLAWQNTTATPCLLVQFFA
jgi:hypothetical protein